MTPLTGCVLLFFIVQALAGKIDSLDLSLISSIAKERQGSPASNNNENEETSAPVQETINAWGKYCWSFLVLCCVYANGINHFFSFLDLGEEEQTKAKEAHTTLEREILALKAQIAAKEEENAHLLFEKEDLANRLSEEEAAVARGLEEQQALETRTREAEAQMDQMMRALSQTTSPPPIHLHPHLSAGERLNVAAEKLSSHQQQQEEEQPRSARSPSPTPSRVVSAEVAAIQEGEEEEVQTPIKQVVQEDEEGEEVKVAENGPTAETVDVVQSPARPGHLLSPKGVSSPLASVVVEDDYIDSYRQKMTPERELLGSRGDVEESTGRLNGEMTSSAPSSPTHNTDAELISPSSPNVQQIYEEKLSSVEKVGKTFFFSFGVEERLHFSPYTHFTLPYTYRSCNSFKMNWRIKGMHMSKW